MSGIEECKAMGCKGGIESMVNKGEGELIGEVSWEFLLKERGDVAGGIAEDGFKD